MKALLRGFLAGFGFALGASVAGTLIGYTIGRIGEASVKRLLSPEPTSSPSPSSSQPSSEQPASDDWVRPESDTPENVAWRDGYEEGLAMGSGVDQRPMTMTKAALYRPNDHPYVRKEFVGHCVYEVAPGTVCGWDESAHHKSNYGAFSCEQCSYRTSVKEKAFGHHVATGHDIFDEKPDVHRNAAYGALAGTCRRCGSREILQHPDGEYCGKCGYGTPGDRASISVVHDGKCPGETMGTCSGGPAHHPDCPAAHHSTDYVPGTVTMPLAPELVAIDELCDARNGDLKCILSKGHTKPVDHWNGTFGFTERWPDGEPGDDEDDGSDYFRALDRHDKQPDEEA